MDKRMNETWQPWGFIFRELPQFVPCDRDVSPLSGNHGSSEVSLSLFHSYAPASAACKSFISLQKETPDLPFAF